MVSNKAVLEQIKTIPKKELLLWFKSLDSNTKAADSSYRTVFKKCEEKYRKLKKSEKKVKNMNQILKIFWKQILNFPISYLTADAKQKLKFLVKRKAIVHLKASLMI